jgi:transposase
MILDVRACLPLSSITSRTRQTHKTTEPWLGAWLGTQRHWLVVEYLPGYAHDLDPVEGLWANLKGVELANLCRDTIAEVIDAAHQGIGRVRRESRLLFSFLRHCGLKL